MNQRFIVTGGAGFIGSNIVAELNAQGHKNILIVDNLNSDIKKQNLDTLTFQDYVDKQAFRALLQDDKVESAHTVFHMGACSSTTETNEEYILDNNYEYTRDLCEWSLAKDARFIYASSAATYGDGALGYADDVGLIPNLKPLNLYGNSKQLFDMWAIENNLLDRIVGLKFFNVYGPREDHKGDMRSVINKAYDHILKTGHIKLFKSHNPSYKDGEQERDFIYVKDAVDVCMFFHNNIDQSGIFNCGTGNARTWVDLANALFAAMNVESNIEFIDMPENLREKYQYHTEADIQKLRNAGYKNDFNSIEDGVKDYVKSYLESQKQGE